MARGEQAEHLLDLHDLLRGGAEKTEEGLAEGLAQDAQAGEGPEAAMQVQVAPQRQRIRERHPVGVHAEIAAQGLAGGVRHAGGSAPLQGVAVEAELGEVFAPNPGPESFCFRPPERLSAIKGLAEDVRRRPPITGQWLPAGPSRGRRGYFPAGLSHK